MKANIEFDDLDIKLDDLQYRGILNVLEYMTNFEELEELPGVGHKTASVIMSQAFGISAFPIDTHIHRLAHRWGLSNGKSVTQTEKDQVIKSRRGQGTFRNRVSEIEDHCRVTSVNRLEHLIASHIKL